jgi:hypothetical protein
MENTATLIISIIILVLLIIIIVIIICCRGETNNNNQNKNNFSPPCNWWSGHYGTSQCCGYPNGASCIVSYFDGFADIGACCGGYCDTIWYDC